MKNPLDDDANNDYEITISVTDGLYTNSTDFTINVLNLNDNSPVFTCEPDNGNPNYEFQCVDTVITIDESDERTQMSRKQWECLLQMIPMEIC